jgi:hypothetical protein
MYYPIINIVNKNTAPDKINQARYIAITNLIINQVNLKMPITTLLV